MGRALFRKEDIITKYIVTAPCLTPVGGTMHAASAPHLRLWSIWLELDSVGLSVVI